MANTIQENGRSRSGCLQTKRIVGIAAHMSAAMATYKAYWARFALRRMKIHIANEANPNKKQNLSESVGLFHSACLQTLRIVISIGFTKPKTAGHALASAPELR